MKIYAIKPDLIKSANKKSTCEDAMIFESQLYHRFRPAMNCD